MVELSMKTQFAFFAKVEDVNGCIAQELKANNALTIQSPSVVHSIVTMY